MNQLIGCFANYVTSSARFSPPDFMNVYYQIRSSQLDRSIKGLKEHFCKNSASSGILYSPAVQTKRKDTPTKKAPKRPGEWAAQQEARCSHDRGGTTRLSDIILFRPSLPPSLILFPLPPS